MMRITCESSMEVAGERSILPDRFDVDPVEAVHHHLGDRVVCEELLERAVADVSAPVAVKNELAPLVPRQWRFG